MKQKQQCLIAVLVMTLWLIAPAYAATGKGNSEPRILLLYSYHPTFPTSGKIIEGFRQGLGDLQVIIEVEYMDTKRHYDDAYLDLFHRSLRYKLQHRDPIDLVVTADDNALNFMLKHGEALFPQTPVVFLGVNNKELAMQMDSNPDVTGVVEAVSIEETIALVRSFRPGTDTLHIIVDGTISGRSDLRSALALKRKFPELQFKVIDLAGLSWAVFTEHIQAIPSKDAILLLSAFRDLLEESLSFEDSLELISMSAQAPVYHPFEHGLGDGALGGIVISHYEQARQAALMATQILTGTEVKDIPVLDKSPNLPIFDKRLLDKFDIPLDRLPRKSQIRYNQPTLFEIYWVETLVVVAIIGLLLSIIAILANQNRLRKALTYSLRESEFKLRTILDNVDAYIYMKDAKGQYLFANQRLRAFLGLSLKEIISKNDNELFDPDTAGKIIHADRKVLSSGELYRQEENFHLAETGMDQDILTTKIPLIDEHGDIYAICGISLDISEQKAYELKLENIAHYDQLTGLPNRVLFYDRLQQAMRSCVRKGTQLSVLYFDLDGFKEVNDNYSHAFGDELLKVITERTQHVIRESDTVARLGGDEFIVLLVESSSPLNDVEISQRILQRISEPVEFEGTVVSVTASIGITRYPQEIQLEADHLLRQADQAMYIAKNDGRNRYHFYSADLEDKAERKQELINEVSDGLGKEEFVLFFQPKVDLTNGELIGAEALIRWQHPEKGLLAPGAFLPDIEHHKVMYQLDEWVISEALNQLQKWQESGFEIPVSVNVSHLFFKQDNPAQVLREILKNYPDVCSSLLEIEIVETQALDNLKEVASIMRNCQRLPVHFALDDFGTGYSSLTYLKQLPIDVLKVDKSFVIDMLEDEEDRTILEGILALCNAFNIMAIAEGMETIEQGVQLKKMGYRYVQGYGVAKPMPAGELPKWHKEWKVPDQWLNESGYISDMYLSL
ncbi:EAL domain-containing protein [Vibrio sp. JC009]|uniref:ABC transporter substrate binding protein n=1 Tax=Vibrio sp. JC009 TaxID=2912314 RepID=UPI0023AF0D29|nr:ABC transporter substrate binding protein [Vibrio sp. JC009]WED20729.1 EAL domain-containing protein [Vibrio sp. JC009]